MNRRKYSQIADDWDADRIISATSEPQEEFEIYRDSTSEKPFGLTLKDFTDYIEDLKSHEK